MYNYIVTTIGKGNGSFLVLLDLSAAFDTMDHVNLFYILEKYVGIGGSALWLILTYFRDRTHILSVYSPFSDRVGLPLHNIHIPSLFTSTMDIFFVDLKFGHIHFYTL